MRIVSFGPRGREKPGVLHGDRIIDLAVADRTLPATVRKILEEGSLDRIGRLIETADSLECGARDCKTGGRYRGDFLLQQGAVTQAGEGGGRTTVWMQDDMRGIEQIASVVDTAAGVE